MRSMSFRKDSIALSLFVIAFFLFTAVLPSYAAEPDTSKPEDDSKGCGFMKGAGEVTVGAIKGTDETLRGFGTGFQNAAEGFGKGVESSVNGFAGGTGKVLGGAFGDKSQKSSQTTTETTTTETTAVK